MASYKRNNKPASVVAKGKEYEAAYNEAYQEAYEEAYQLEREKTLREVALSLLQQKISMDVITSVTKISADEVRKIASQHGLAV